MNRKEEAHRLLDRLSESDLAAVTRMLRALVLLPPEVQPVPGPSSEEERQARVDALYGSMPELPPVAEFLREKHEEADREETKAEAKDPGKREAA